MDQPEQQQITTVLAADDNDRRALIAQAAPSLEQAPGDRLAGHKVAPPLIESAKSGWLRFGNTGQGLLAASAGDAKGALADAYDPTFDYAEYWAEHKTDYRDLEKNYMAGHFDEVRSPSAWARRAFMLRENNMLDRDIAAGGTLGLVVGLGASLFDVTNLIGFGAVMTGARALTRAGRIAQGLQIGAAEGAVSAAIMQELDVTQDWKDAVLDIGVGSLAGGALGSFAKHVPADSPLLPGHPQNPMHPDNLGADPIHIIKPGQLAEEGAVIHSSGGAAAVSPETAARVASLAEDSLPAMGTGIVGRAVQGTTDAVAGAANKASGLLLGRSVFDRMAEYPPYLRGLLTQGLDQFGYLNRAMARGDAAAPEAEALVNTYRQKGRGLQEELKESLRNAQTALGESKLAARMRGAVDDLTNGKVQTIRITREEFFGEAVAHMRAKLTNNVRAETEIKARLSKPGRTPEQVDTLYSHVLKAAETAKKHMDAMAHEAVDTGLMDKSTHLGEGYGLPIMFVRGEIMRNRSKFENIVMRLLEKQPQEEWLKSSGWVREKVTAVDGVGGIEARTWDDIQADPALHNQVLREWNGELKHNLREEAAAAWTDASTRLERSLNEVQSMAEGLKLSVNDKKLTSATAAKMRAREMEAGWQARNLGYAKGRADKARARLDELATEYPDLLDLGEHARHRFEATGPEVDQALTAGLEAKAKKSEAADLVAFLRDERSGPKDPVSGQRPGKLQPGGPEYVSAMAKIDEAIQTHRAASLEVDEATATLREAATRQRNAARFYESAVNDAEQFRKDAHAADTGEGIVEMLSIQRHRLDELHAKVAEARRAHAESIEVWKQTRKGLGIGRKELRAAKAEFKRSGRLVEKLGARTPKAEYAEQLARSLSGLDQHPSGMLMEEAPEIGRLKERRFKWTEELLSEAQHHGLVESDLSYMMDRYTREMGGRLALHKAYGGQSYSTLARNVDDDLRQWVDQAPQGHPDRQRREQLHKQGLEDFKHAWDRLAGKHQVEPTDMASFAVKTLMNGAYIRIAGGIAKAAVQDVGTAIFSSPGFVRQVLTNGRAYSKLTKEIEHLIKTGDESGRLEGLRQIKVLLASMENAAQTGISQRAIGRGSALDQFGIGEGITRTMTRELEVGMQNIGDKVTWATGLNFISDFIRQNAAFAHIADMAHFAKKPWADLSASRKAQLASMNIGEAEHKRLGELMKKHGTTHGSLFDPGIDQWNDPRMVELFETSTVKAQNRAAYTESIGANPVALHDGSIYQKALGQFQSHAYMTLRQFIQAAAQRGAVTGDYYSGMAAMATSIALGTLMSVVRGFENGKDTISEWEKNPSKLGREVLERSGILGAASPMFDAGTKLFGGHLNKMLGTKFFDPGSKYSQNNAVMSFLGPAAGEAKSIWDLVSATTDGEFDKAGQKLLRLVPFNQQIRGLMEVHNALEN